MIYYINSHTDFYLKQNGHWFYFYHVLPMSLLITVHFHCFILYESALRVKLFLCYGQVAIKWQSIRFKKILLRRFNDIRRGLMGGELTDKL